MSAPNSAIVRHCWSCAAVIADGLEAFSKSFICPHCETVVPVEPEVPAYHFLDGVQRCNQGHEKPEGWPAALRGWPAEQAIVLEGHCALCPPVRLERRTGSPWRDEDAWLYCPCCDTCYRLEQQADGLHLSTTGGINTTIVFPDGSVA